MALIPETNNKENAQSMGLEVCGVPLGLFVLLVIFGFGRKRQLVNVDQTYDVASPLRNPTQQNFRPQDSLVPKFMLGGGA